ncbi:nuclease [Halorubrum tibetense]|uniref:Nuclease n=1 Tax=Halorubrum tibetense TaxID=175631 RepID=A0ABD5S8F9_9EURY
MGYHPSDDGGGIGRRGFLGLTGAALGTAAVASGSSFSPVSALTNTDVDLDAVSFYSPASQIAADGESELADPEQVVVWAPPDSVNFETTDDGPTTVVYEENPIPLVSEDGPVVGFGSVDLVSDDQGGFDLDNEEFLLNVFDEKMGGSGTVLWDEGHDQFGGLALSNYNSFDQYAANAGYDLTATTDVLGTTSLRFPSTASQVNPSGGPLTNSEHVVVWAEDTAENVDNEEDGAYIYADDEEIPLVSRDGDVVGLGTPEIIEDGDLTAANEAFALNLIADTVGSSGTLVWDDAHDTFYDSSKFDAFADAVESEGYAFEATDDLLGDSVGGVDELEFFSTASLLDENGDPLTDESLIAVWAEPTAENVDELGTGFVDYADVDADIPLVAVDDGVVGLGTELAPDASGEDDNREFLVNAWEDRLDGTGTVLFDESHGQSLSLDDFSELEAVAESRGFDVESVADPIAFEAALDDVDLLMVASEDDDIAGGFPEDDLDALADFVDDGGVLFLHDTADFGGDSTDTLNGIAEAVDAAFRFNTDQVVDEENSGFASFVPRTSNVNDDFGFFTADGGEEGDGEIPGDALFVPSPADAYTDAELDALVDFVADGGSLFLLDESEFANEETANLNAIADTLDLPFRFNADQVEDFENNAGDPYLPTTTNFNEGFDVFAGLDAPGLDEADGLVVPSPTEAFSGAELDALDEFLADGGALFLFDESDFGGQGNTAFGFDETENLNAIAESVDLAFRFNSDQVNTADGDFDVATSNFNTSFDYFGAREDSIGIDFQRDEAYYGRVVRVFDGDTFEVEFDSEYDYRDVIRHLGFDTAETPPATNETEEWFGIEDLDHLDTWGENATEFALDLMAPDAEAGETDVEGRRVKMEFDEVEPLRGNFGRLLSYMYYDPDDFDADADNADAPDDAYTGEYDADYNLETVEEGYSRVYSSGFSRHDEFAAVEEAALADGRGVWSAADFDALDPIRNEPYEELFVPRTSSITTTDGPLTADRVPVYAGENAQQEAFEDGENGTGGFDGYEDPPLVGVDEDNRVAMVGGLLFNETYEESEGFVDTSGFGNFPFLYNLASYLSNNDGDLLLEGGHAQFDVEGSLSLERVQFFLRFVEGVGSRLRQFNDVVNTLPAADEPTAVLLTSPGRAYTDAELDALAEYRDEGGAVVLLGSTAASGENRSKLDDVAAGLGSDLRINGDRVVDDADNLDDDPAITVTDRFDEAFPLFDPVGEGPLAGVDPETQAYLELIANDEGKIDRDALDGATADWAAGRIDRETLDVVVEAYTNGTVVVAP